MLEKGVFHRLGDNRKSMSTYSNDSRHLSYHSSRGDTESCYQSSRSRETEFASKKLNNKKASSRRMGPLSESKHSAGGHWKSKPKRQKSSIKDDLPQPWVCEETDPFTPWICYLDFPKTRMPSHLKTYDESEDPKDHPKIFQATAKTKHWAMPTWCHMFNSKLTRNARVWLDDLSQESNDSYDDLKKAFLENYLQQKNASKIRTKFIISSREIGNPRKGLCEGEEDGTEGPMIIKVEMGGNFVHRMYVDGGSSSEILKVTILIQRNHRKARSKENLGSSVYSLRNDKIPNDRRNGHITEQYDYSIRMHNGFRTRSTAAHNQPSHIRKSRVAIHLEYLKQTIAIGSTLIEEGRASYQRLMDNAFQKQIGRNLEVYVDDLVIKRRTEQEVIRDIEETFKTLREINMKLNTKKCIFGMREGMFLGYKVNADGLRVCLNKVEAVLSLPSLKCLKNVQRLNGKRASLNRFLSKSAEKSLPFFKTLKKCTKKSDFQWTAEEEMTFKQMKK
nr:reverse transcriptase domain-containing protein [Tanacetum cinerariifolium]